MRSAIGFTACSRGIGAKRKSPAKRISARWRGAALFRWPRPTKRFTTRRRVQDVLTAIRHGVALVSCGRRLKPNAEHALKPPQAFARLFEDDPASVARTLEVAERCRFSLGEIRYRYPSERLPNGMTSLEWLRRQTFNGARRRYEKGIPAAIAAQIEK